MTLNHYRTLSLRYGEDAALVTRIASLCEEQLGGIGRQGVVPWRDCMLSLTRLPTRDAFVRIGERQYGPNRAGFNHVRVGMPMEAATYYLGEDYEVTSRGGSVGFSTSVMTYRPRSGGVILLVEVNGHVASIAQTGLR